LQPRQAARRCRESQYAFSGTACRSHTGNIGEPFPGPAEMELTMRKSSTFTLVAVALAALAGATLAHAWLLSPERPADDIAGRTSPVVTIVHGGPSSAAGLPIEIASRAARQVTVAQSAPGQSGITHLFGPRTLPLWRRSFGWQDASIDVGRSAPTDRFVTVVADTASVTCDQAWARPTAGAGTTGAAYFTLTNNGGPDALVGASTPIAASASAHETIDDAGVMKMRPAPSIALAPGQQVTFRPSGYHVMLIGLKAPLKAGDSFPLTLSFAHAQPVTVTVKVQAGAAGMGNASMPGMR
jgi:copper(I)-binding protein